MFTFNDPMFSSHLTNIRNLFLGFAANISESKNISELFLTSSTFQFLELDSKKLIKI